jgi:hypothetical protein
MNRYLFVILFAFAGGIADRASAVTLQPAEADSKDTFVYEFLPTFNFNGAPFGAFLPAGKTDTPADGHDTQSLLEFDLSSVTLAAPQVTSATLELYAVDTAATGFGANPTPGAPVVVNLFAVAGTWDEGTLMWNTLPGTAGQFSSATITGINQPFTFDVTNLVKQWLDGTLPNHGMMLVADAAVPASSTFAAATFSSAAGSVAPKLTIVPEPTGIALAGCAIAAVSWFGLRRGFHRHRLQ